MRRILYLSGTRADYGLMKRTLRAIQEHPTLELGVVVTAMHLDPRHGNTVREIEADGFRIAGRIQTDSGTSPSFMARAIANVVNRCCDIFETEAPDLLLLLGDRGEMLAGAIAAIHLNIPIAHIHGGERSGTVDEPIRHAISKMAHLHLVATAEAEQRLMRMGERPDCLFHVGAPGLDGLFEDASLSREHLLKDAELPNNSRIALLVFHPVVQNADKGAGHISAILSALRKEGYAIIALRPNSDLGGEAIRAVLDAAEGDPDIRLYTHIPRDQFVSWMAISDLIIGNSSAGIIEAASFGTPVINVGSRQRLRERNRNVIDVEPELSDLAQALAAVACLGRFPPDNVYGDGRSAARIANLLADVSLESALLEKYCVY